MLSGVLQFCFVVKMTTGATHFWKAGHKYKQTLIYVENRK